MALQVGDSLPDFSLPNQDNQPVNAESLRGRPLVLFFYPKDNTPGCTAEACAFRDTFADFRNLNAQVIGVSADSPESHRKFINQYQLPFPLLSDTGNKLRKAWGVPGSLFGLLPGRVTYIFDAEGRLKHIFNAQFQAKRHIQEALEAIK